MKISDMLYQAAPDLWDEAADKPFVKAMAEGSLDEGLFRRYMIQDYLYLAEYIEILNMTKAYSESKELTDFIDSAVIGTENEIKRVHIPNMKKIGITDEEIKAAQMNEVISDYISYMKSCLNGYGLLAGLSALLQCSWVYAYISDADTKKYAKEIKISEHKDWFFEYTSQNYTDANRKWVDIIDKISESREQSELENIKKIFMKCAEFENRFWDSL